MRHTARALSALILHVLYTPETERTLAGVHCMVTDPAYYFDIATLVDPVCRSAHDHDARMGWHDALGVARESEQSGIFTTLTRGLAIFGDPIVARNTEVTDFDFDDLFDGIAISVRMPASARYAPLYRGITALLDERVEERLRYGPLRYPPYLSVSL